VFQTRSTLIFGRKHNQDFQDSPKNMRIIRDDFQISRDKCLQFHRLAFIIEAYRHYVTSSDIELGGLGYNWEQYYEMGFGYFKDKRAAYQAALVEQNREHFAELPYADAS
jgi:hypothetical protein